MDENEIQAINLINLEKSKITQAAVTPTVNASELSSIQGEQRRFDDLLAQHRRNQESENRRFFEAVKSAADSLDRKVATASQS